MVGCHDVSRGLVCMVCVLLQFYNVISAIKLHEKGVN